MNSKQVNSTSELNCGVLILAAGYSTRFGSDKRQYELPCGRLLIEATIDAYMAVLDHCVVILRQSDCELQARLEMRYKHATNIRFVNAVIEPIGMGFSISEGIKFVGTNVGTNVGTKGWDTCLIALADMPYVLAETISAIADAVTSNSIVVPVCHDSSGRKLPGHPVGFGSAYFHELGTLTGDRGARSILNLHQHYVEYLAVEDAGIVQDIDNLSDI